MSKSKRKDCGNLINVSCNNCGMCCRNRGDISLTPLDVFNISQYLKMYPKDFINTYCVVGRYLDVKLKATEPFNSCIFLKNNSKGKTYCDIYSVRPMACYLYPLKMVEGSINEFRMDSADFCPTTKRGTPIVDYVRDKSSGRYKEEFVHIHRYLTALRLYYINPNGSSEQEMLEYFYYNESAEELKRKIDDFIFL